MSADAMRAVMETSPARGAGLLALLAIAHASKDRHSYPRAQISLPALARLCRCNTRAITYTVKGLLKRGVLFIHRADVGQEAAIYEIPVIVKITGLQKPKGQGLQDSATVVREDPQDTASRADRTDNGTVLPLGELPTNVVRYSVSRENDRTGT